MAQVRFYPTDLRRKSASHTLLMAQVPPLKTDLLHSSHPPAPLTLQACTTHPTHLRQRTHCPARRHHQAQNSAAAHNQVRRLLSHGTAPSHNAARGLASTFLGTIKGPKKAPPSFRKQASSKVPYSPSAGYCHTEGEARVHLLPV